MVSGPLEDFCLAFQKPFACVLCTLSLVSLIVFFTSIKTLAPEEQVVVHYLNGNAVVNGPCTKILNPFREQTWRTRLKVGELEYARVKNTLANTMHVVEGLSNDFMGPYDETDGVMPKIVLQKDQYVRLTHRLTGAERIFTGPTSVIPDVWEEVHAVERAIDVNKDQAVVVLNKADGTKRMHETSGLFFPQPYEEIVETRTLIRVLPHETMVVSNSYGRYEIRSGAGADGNGTGIAFFLRPFEEIVEMDWSAYSEPEDGQEQKVTMQRVSRIDMRARRTPFQFGVRTNDNVPMRIEGTIFWKVVDVGKLIQTTADPPGDVFFKSRNALISAVSAADLEKFMNGFNALIEDAFAAQASESFYSDRGVEVDSVQVTKYDCTDVETAETLQAIIEETTDRINRLTAQKSENDVKAAKLFADITIERDRYTLITSQAHNERLLASLEGQADGIQLAVSDTTFLNQLNQTVPDLDQRMELYNLHKKLENQNTRTRSIASYKKATLMLTPSQMHLDSMKMKLNEL